MHKAALVAGAVLLQSLTAHAEEVRVRIPAALAKQVVEAWRQPYREKVELLRRLHEPGRQITKYQESIYKDIIDALQNHGLGFEDIGTTNEELNALAFGGDIV